MTTYSYVGWKKLPAPPINFSTGISTLPDGQAIVTYATSGQFAVYRPGSGWSPILALPGIGSLESRLSTVYNNTIGLYQFTGSGAGPISIDITSGAVTRRGNAYSIFGSIDYPPAASLYYGHSAMQPTASALYFSYYPDCFFFACNDNTPPCTYFVGIDILTGIIKHLIVTDLTRPGLGFAFRQNGDALKAIASGSTRVAPTDYLFPNALHQMSTSGTNLPNPGVIPGNFPLLNNFLTVDDISYGTGIDIAAGIRGSVRGSIHIMNTLAPTSDPWGHTNTFIGGVYYGTRQVQISYPHKIAQFLLSQSNGGDGFGSKLGLHMPNSMAVANVTSIDFAPLTDDSIGFVIRIPLPAGFRTDFWGLASIGSVPHILDLSGNFYSLQISATDFTPMNCVNWLREWRS